MSKKFITFIVLFLILAFVYVLSASMLDNKVNDVFTKTFLELSKKKASDEVVLVVVDDVSIDKIQWPWQRQLFSDIFTFLEKDCGAKAIVFQNLVVLPDSYNPKSDAIFYKTIAQSDKLINSFIFVNSNVAGDVLPSEYLTLFESKNKVYIENRSSFKTDYHYRAVFNLPKEYLLSVNNFASSILPEDKDEILRSYMPIVQLNDTFYPSLALSAYSLYTGITNFVLYDDYFCSADECKSLKIPVYKHLTKDYIGNSIEGIYSKINWYTPTSEYYSHKKYSAIDVLVSAYSLKDGKSPKLNPNLFKDKVVIIGLNADKNVWDQLSETPVLEKQADVDVHATMLNNMLSNSFFTEQHDNSTLLITTVFTFFVVFGFRRLKTNLLFALVLSFVYFVYYIIQFFSLVSIPPISPILTIISATFLKEIFLLITVDKNAELIKKAMGKFVSKDVMKKVLADVDKLNVGGTRAVVTILFVDIRNFTQISENLSPQDVTSVLNEYFSLIEPIIAAHKGIINKYMGDGVLAVFGEPIKDDNHALNAIKCGSEIRNQVKILREKLISEGKPKIEIGIGINTGEVFAGNIGTEERLEYTVIGDNVNLAYRIESYNQLLKTNFLISQYTYDHVSDYVDVVKLSQVEIKGKSKPIDIYEILKIKNDK